MTEKTVFASIPVSAAIDLVQLRLQIIASDLELYAQSASAPGSSELERAYTELISLANLIKEVEKKENT